MSFDLILRAGSPANPSSDGHAIGGEGNTATLPALPHECLVSAFRDEFGGDLRVLPATDDANDATNAPHVHRMCL